MALLSNVNLSTSAIGIAKGIFFHHFLIFLKTKQNTMIW